MSKLYLVSTPIGNLNDITFRAIHTLKTVGLVLAEDTRVTKKLLSNYQIYTPIESFFEHNEEKKIDTVIQKLKQGQAIALVSDGGSPLISDPGYKLVREAVKNGIEVESIPGPSAVLTALTSSGLPTDQFLFIGYLPKKPGKINSILEFVDTVIKMRATTIIFFESPHRLAKTLIILAEKFPESELVVARELTKIHEEFIRDKAQNMVQKKIIPKGEITILLR